MPIVKYPHSCRTWETGVLQCEAGYRVKGTSAPEDTLVCTEGHWLVSGTGAPPDDSTCLPHCERGCGSRGTCVAPNICHCPMELWGEACQLTACMEEPPIVVNGSFHSGR